MANFSSSSIVQKIAGSLLLAIPLLASEALAAPATLVMDNAKSSVGIVFKQMNVPVDAKFKKFNALIQYDSAKPEASKATVEIDLASFDLGDPEYSKEVLKKEWFNAAQFPKASFVSTGMKALANGQLEVTGVLTIKGKAINSSFPLSVKKVGNQQFFDGNLSIKRLAFQIGEGEWKDTAILADEVIIKFHVVAM